MPSLFIDAILVAFPLAPFLLVPIAMLNGQARVNFGIRDAGVGDTQSKVHG